MRADPFLTRGPANHSVWIRPVNSNDLYGVTHGGVLYTLSGANVSVVDICNANPICDRRLVRRPPCIAVTPTCNCLKWVGNLNSERSTGRIFQIDSFSAVCVRVACVGECTAHIDWFAGNVNMSVPVTYLEPTENVRQSSAAGADETASTFFKKFFYGKLCDPFAYTAFCPAVSRVTLRNLRNSELDADLQVAYPAFMSAILIAAVAGVLFHEASRGRLKFGSKRSPIITPAQKRR